MVRELKRSGLLQEHASKVELFAANFNHSLGLELREALRREIRGRIGR
jgi:hypothetical protein